MVQELLPSHGVHGHMARRGNAFLSPTRAINPGNARRSRRRTMDFSSAELRVATLSHPVFTVSMASMHTRESATLPALHIPAYVLDALGSLHGLDARLYAGHRDMSITKRYVARAGK